MRLLTNFALPGCAFGGLYYVFLLRWKFPWKPQPIRKNAPFEYFTNFYNYLYNPLQSTFVQPTNKVDTKVKDLLSVLRYNLTTNIIKEPQDRDKTPRDFNVFACLTSSTRYKDTATFYTIQISNHDNFLSPGNILLSNINKYLSIFNKKRPQKKICSFIKN